MDCVRRAPGLTGVFFVCTTFNKSKPLINQALCLFQIKCMKKITELSPFFKWDNWHNYYFALLYVPE